MDDVTLFGNSHAALMDARDRIARWLDEERRLRLKRPERQPQPTSGTFRYLGRRITRAGIAPTRAAWKRFEQKVGRLLGQGKVATIERSMASFRGSLLSLT